MDERDARYDQRFEAQQQATRDALSATEQAIDKSEATNIRRFEAVDLALEGVTALMARVERLDGAIAAVDRLTDAKFVTFRTLIDSEAQKVQLALEASNQAISKKEAADEKRFEAVNEFRGQLRDQAATLLPRAEADVRLTSMSGRIDELTNRLNRMTGSDEGESATRSLQSRATAQTIAICVAVVAALGLVVTIILAFNN